jgi:hypothetical protein
MALTDNPNVKGVWTSCRIELPDHRDPKWVFVVATDLPLRPEQPGYDLGAANALMEAIAGEARRLNITQIEIVPETLVPSAPPNTPASV